MMLTLHSNDKIRIKWLYTSISTEWEQHLSSLPDWNTTVEGNDCDVFKREGATDNRRLRTTGDYSA